MSFQNHYWHLWSKIDRQHRCVFRKLLNCVNYSSGFNYICELYAYWCIKVLSCWHFATHFCDKIMLCFSCFFSSRIWSFFPPELSVQFSWASPIGKQKNTYPGLVCSSVFTFIVLVISALYVFICLHLSSYVFTVFYNETFLIVTMPSIIIQLTCKPKVNVLEWSRYLTTKRLPTYNILYSAKFHFDLFKKENQNTSCIDHTVKLNQPEAILNPPGR